MQFLSPMLPQAIAIEEVQLSVSNKDRLSHPNTSNDSIVGTLAESQNTRGKIDLSVSQYNFDFDYT